MEDAAQFYQFCMQTLSKLSEQIVQTWHGRRKIDETKEKQRWRSRRWAETLKCTKKQKGRNESLDKMLQTWQQHNFTWMLLSKVTAVAAKTTKTTETRKMKLRDKVSVCCEKCCRCSNKWVLSIKFGKSPAPCVVTCGWLGVNVRLLDFTLKLLQFLLTFFLLSRKINFFFLWSEYWLWEIISIYYLLCDWTDNGPARSEPFDNWK